MTPKEIQSLLQQSPLMRKAMETDKQRIWSFLRHEVASGSAISRCVQCREMGMMLETPCRPDLCIPCLLALLEELKDNPITDNYRDQRSRDYDALYDEQCKSWDDLYTMPDDYDGPPFAIG